MLASNPTKGELVGKYVICLKTFNLPLNPTHYFEFGFSLSSGKPETGCAMFQSLCCRTETEPMPGDGWVVTRPWSLT